MLAVAGRLARILAALVVTGAGTWFLVLAPESPTVLVARYFTEEGPYCLVCTRHAEYHPFEKTFESFAPYCGQHLPDDRIVYALWPSVDRIGFLLFSVIAIAGAVVCAWACAVAPDGTLWGTIVGPGTLLVVAEIFRGALERIY